MVQDVVVELEEQDLGVVPMPRGEWLLIRGDPQDSAALGGVGRDSRRLGAIGRGISIPGVVVALLGRVARLLGPDRFNKVSLYLPHFIAQLGNRGPIRKSPLY
jgi:hypothetical protein